MQPLGPQLVSSGVPQLHAAQLAKAGADHDDHPWLVGLDACVLQCLTGSQAKQPRGAQGLRLAGDLIGRALFEQARLEIGERTEAALAPTERLEELETTPADAGDHAGAGDDEIVHGRASPQSPRSNSAQATAPSFPAEVTSPYRCEQPGRPRWASSATHWKAPAAL